jgi:tetratricopeptide (TPR) repeat protein
LLLLLLALAQPAEPQPQHSLDSYLRIVGAYRSANRTAAVREIRGWPPSVVRATVGEVEERGLRGSPESTDSIAIDTVEAAVLMHAEAGLLALREVDNEPARSHLKAMAALFAWSRQEASKLRAQREALLRVSNKDVQERFPLPQYDVHPRIDRVLLSTAVAAGALAAGQPVTAQPFAEDAKRYAPQDPDVLLVFGAVAEGLASSERTRGREESARRWDDEARLALATAVTHEAGPVPDPTATALPSPSGLEARLRLGRIALDDGRLEDARRWLEEVDARSVDSRQRHLAWLLLGRAADGQGRSDEATSFFRRALDACPTSQATALAWAHAVERSSGPRAAEPLVAQALAMPLRAAATVDPWRAYLFGPPGFAEAALARVRRETLER